MEEILSNDANPLQNDVQAPEQDQSTNPTQEVTEASQPPLNSFFDSLPDHLKQNKSLSKFDSVDKLADAYVNASRLIGKKVSDIKVGDLNSVLDADQLAEVYKAVGKPTSIDEYTLPDTLDKEISDFVKTKALELEISGDKLNKLLEMEQQLSMKQREKVQESWRAEVFNKFGKDFEPAIKTAQAAVKEFGGEDLINYLNQTGLGDHPAMVAAFAKIGSLMKEDSVPHQGSISSSDVSAAESEIAKFKNDPVMYKKWRDGDPGAREMLNNLYSRLK